MNEFFYLQCLMVTQEFQKQLGCTTPFPHETVWVGGVDEEAKTVLAVWGNGSSAPVPFQVARHMAERYALKIELEGITSYFSPMAWNTHVRAFMQSLDN